MKTLKKAVLFICLITSVSRLAAQTKHSEEMTVPLSEPGKPVTLEAHLMKGSIKVIGYEGKDVIIQVLMDSSKEEEEDRDDDSRGMKRIGSTGGMDVRADEDNNNGPDQLFGRKQAGGPDDKSPPKYRTDRYWVRSMAEK